MIPDNLLSLRVRAIEALSPTLKRLVFEAADGGSLPASPPGGHLALTMAGPDRIYRNSYSVISHHDERTHYEIIVRRTDGPRGGSAHVHERLTPGDIVSAAMPNSHFPLRNIARRHLLIGGGIGITPLLSYLPVLRDRHDAYELHQFARAAEVAVFEALLLPHAGHRVHVHGGRGVLAVHDILARQPLGTHVYCCGPAALMEGVRDAAVALGWPATAVHFESFGTAGGEPFTVRLATTGGEVAVGEHETMLEALENAGLSMKSLCRGGACGECLTHVVDGTPEHRDHFLSDAERAGGRLVMPCVSRSTTPALTLDL